MNGVAADHAAERDHAVIGLAAPLGGVERDRNRAGDFQRARNADAVEGNLRGFEHARRAGQQRVGDVVVKPRLDHEESRAHDGNRFALRPARLGHGFLRCSP